MLNEWGMIAGGAAGEGRPGSVLLPLPEGLVGGRRDPERIVSNEGKTAPKSMAA
jgi:hypothetical protein